MWPNRKMAFFKFRNRNRSSATTNTIVISKPIPATQPDDQPSRQQSDYRHQQPSAGMDHDNRRPPPTPLKLRGSYYALNTGTSLSRVPSSPLPPLPSFDSVDDLPTPNGYSDREEGYARGIGRFERIRTEAEDMLLSPEGAPINRFSTSTDGLPECPPISTSPPKLRLSFESNITEAGSVYDLDTPPNHRVAIKPTFGSSNSRHASTPERIITAPAVEPDARTKTISSSNGSQLRRQSAVYKRRASMEVTETSSSRSGKSTLDSPEDRDSGFHEDFDEALRSKPPTPETKVPYSDRNKTNSNTSFRVREREKSASPEQLSIAITPERAPLIPSEGRITPITLVDPGVTRKPVAKKPAPLSLPQIEKMETFKETFSTNLFENTLPSEKQRNRLSAKPIVPKAKGKVLTPAEFEKMRQEADNESEEDDEEEDVARDESYQTEITKQRRRQQAALSIYRQQMTKVVGTSGSPNLRPLSQIGEMPEVPESEDENEEVPLGILMAHGFPQTNNRPSSMRPMSRSSMTPQSRERPATLDPKIRSPSPGNLPVFAKNLPTDPHAAGLPRSYSAFDLRPTANGSNSPSLGARTNSTPAVPTLLDSYQTRQRKGAMFLDPNIEVPGQVMPHDQSYFSQVPSRYEMMGMQPVPGQGMIQYVPVMVAPPLGSPGLGPPQPPTLMQELHDRQQFVAQQRLLHRSSQLNLQHPQYPQTKQQQIQQFMASNPFPPIPLSRPQSIYADPRRSFYDQKSIYSSSSQQPTARPKLPSANPVHRFSSASNPTSNPGRYRASTYAGAGLEGTNSSRGVSSANVDNDDAGWESLRRKKEEMQARRMSRMQTAA